MNEINPPPIGQLLKDQNSGLQRIFAKVQQLRQLDAIFKACLDPKLRAHCTVANIYPEKLVILAESAAYATQLRFNSPELLKMLRDKHPLLRELQTLECRLGPVDS